MIIMSKRQLIAGGVIFLLSCMIGVSLWQMREPQGLTVLTYRVKEKDLEKTVFGVGKITSPDKVTIAATVSGRVVNLPVKVGQKVSAGQMLIKLDNHEIEHEYTSANEDLRAKTIQLEKLIISLQQAEINVSLYESKYKRYSNLYNQGAVSAMQLEETEAEFKNSKSHYQTCQKEIDLFCVQENQAKMKLNEVEKRYAATSITAPISGEIFSINVSIGDYIDVGKTLASMGTRNQLEIVIEVNEADASQLAIGNLARIKIPAIPERVFSGTVTKISPIANVKSQDNTFQNVVDVTVSLDTPSDKLRPGYSADITFVLDNKPNAIQIPLEAIVDGADGSKSVWLIRNGAAFRQVVSIGITNELYAEVVTGLQLGDIIVSNHSQGGTLQDGLKVIPTDSEKK